MGGNTFNTKKCNLVELRIRSTVVTRRPYNTALLNGNPCVVNGVPLTLMKVANISRG
jgi:hypothetical protein